MANLIEKDGVLFRYPASLKSFSKLLDPNVILPKNPTLPITVGTYTLLKPEPTAAPEGDVVTPGIPEKTGDTWFQTWVTRSYSEDELATQSKEAARELKLSGVEFIDSTGVNPEPVLCSATKEDMWGLNSVNTSLAMGSPSENFWFDNGNMVVLTPANSAEFMGVWAPFRRSFFQ